MQQVHVTEVSQQMALHRIKGTYSNYGERLYVEGRIEAMKKEQEVRGTRGRRAWPDSSGHVAAFIE